MTDLPHFGPVVPLSLVTAVELERVRAEAATGRRALGLHECSPPPLCYRVFLVGADAEGPVLASPYAAGVCPGVPDTWPGVELRTHCTAPTPCTSPRVACRCGLYAFPHAFPALFMSSSAVAVAEPGGRCVEGLDWGFTIDLPDGRYRMLSRVLRAERLGLRHLFINGEDVDPRTADALRSRYDLPVTGYAKPIELPAALVAEGYGEAEVRLMAAELAATAALAGITERVSH